jgi:cell division protein FtsZ
MSRGGDALMAVGSGTGESRATDAAQAAISSSMLDISIDGAQAILFNVSGSSDLSLLEVNEAAAIISAKAHPDAAISFGAVVDENLEDEVRITVIATGFEAAAAEQRPTPAAAPTEAVGKKTIDFPTVQRFDQEDLDVPAFLRRRSG